MDLYSSITEMKGIGTQKEASLNKLGIYTICDLILHYPRDYSDRSNIRNIKDIVLDEENTILAKVKMFPENINIKNLILTKVLFFDDTGTIEVVFFNQSYLKNLFKLNDKYLLTGKVQKKRSKNVMEVPEYEKIEKNKTLSGGRIVPIYSLTSNVSQKMLRGLIKDVLDEFINQFYEFMPLSIRKKYLLCERSFAISNIHFPMDANSFFIARQRLVFEELFLMQLALIKLKVTLSSETNNVKIKNAELFAGEIENNIEFELTNAQRRVIGEIIDDITSDKIMNRLIQGDVGSGKTAVALIICYIVIKNGYQAVLMAPTEVLATQHFQQFSSNLSYQDINVVLLTGSISKKNKAAISEQIKNGTANMILGTHSIIQDNIQFSKLGLVITDEQHRFGVRQRMTLVEKGEKPHILVMTATPIPRTLALILYGDLDISIVDELPPGRQIVDTWFVNSSYRQRIYEFIKKEVAKGFQTYIICPMIEENEKMDLKAVTQYTNNLREHLNDINIECLHGKMKNTEKQQIMEDFSKGIIQVLVSTTVIEVGINVPNANIMLIENAERFGLAQLHQLRGRVGRGSQKSYCILISDSKSDITKQRLSIMHQTNDGFIISEMDLKIRGPGEYFGTMQHGLADMKIANLYKDIEILKQVQEAVDNLIQIDPNLSLDENSLLLNEVKSLFKYNAL